MPSIVTIYTQRNEFAAVWRDALRNSGITVKTAAPVELAITVDSQMQVIFDAGSPAYDEDELIAATAYARAVGAFPIAHFGEDGRLSGVDDVVEEICSGRIIRSLSEVGIAAAGLIRREDPARSRRFEFLTVSPRENELLAVFGDGHCTLMKRPLDETDDLSPIVSITLGENAHAATLTLATGDEITLHAVRVVAQTITSSGQLGAPVDGPRLGARLRSLRKQAGLTQAELARRTGIHRPNIARVEAGRHTPSLETLTRLANAIGVSATQVLVDN